MWGFLFKDVVSQQVNPQYDKEGDSHQTDRNQQRDGGDIPLTERKLMNNEHGPEENQLNNAE